MNAPNTGHVAPLPQAPIVLSSDRYGSKDMQEVRQKAVQTSGVKMRSESHEITMCKDHDGAELSYPPFGISQLTPPASMVTG